MTGKQSLSLDSLVDTSLTGQVQTSGQPDTPAVAPTRRRTSRTGSRRSTIRADAEIELTGAPKQLSVKVPSPTYARLRNGAVTTEMSHQHIMLEALENWLSDNGF